MKCLPFFHKKRRMPRLMREGERDTGRPGPEYACTRCGKLWYSYVLWVNTLEGNRWSTTLPYWEGQSPPEGYESWEAKRDAVRQGLDQLREAMRNDRRWRTPQDPFRD